MQMQIIHSSASFTVTVYKYYSLKPWLKYHILKHFDVNNDIKKNTTFVR